MRKKILTFAIPILIFIIIFSLILIFNIPRIKYEYDKDTDSYYVSEVYGNAKTYEIKNDYNNKKVTKIGVRAFYNHSNLEEVIIPSNIEYISRLAFAECKKLNKINWENVKEISRNAFADDISLIEINLDNIVDLGASVFINSSVEIINFNNNASLKSIGSLCFMNTNIKKISIPKSCKYLENDTFYNCKNLTEINVYGPYLKENEYLKSLDIVNYIE